MTLAPLNSLDLVPGVVCLSLVSLLKERMTYLPGREDPRAFPRIPPRLVFLRTPPSIRGPCLKGWLLSWDWKCLKLGFWNLECLALGFLTGFNTTKRPYLTLFTYRHAQQPAWLLDLPKFFFWEANLNLFYFPYIFWLFSWVRNRG